MKRLGQEQFIVMGIAVLVFVPVLLLMGSGPVQDKPSRVAALNLPAPTATPEPTATAEPMAVELGAVNRGLIRFSRYDPKLGGPNCARFVNGECLSNMASGLDWRDWMEVACACPKEFPFYTKITLVDSGRECTCLDRGGKIKFIDGIPWIDFLSESAFLPYGSIQLADIQLPK